MIAIMNVLHKITIRQCRQTMGNHILPRFYMFLVIMLLSITWLDASESNSSSIALAGQLHVSAKQIGMDYNDPPITDEPRAKEMYSRRDRFYGVQRLFVGLHFGSMHVFTDLSGKPGDGTLTFPGFLLNDTGMNGGILFRYKLNEWFALGAAISYAGIEASRRTEEGSPEIQSFHTSLGELSLRAEYFWPTLEWSPWDVYAFSGMAFYIQQTEFLDGAGMNIDVEDQPEITNPNLAVPLGIGFSYFIADRVKLGYEFSYRFTGNHILDGVLVSETGADSYMFHSINLSIPIANRSGF